MENEVQQTEMKKVETKKKDIKLVYLTTPVKERLDKLKKEAIGEKPASHIFISMLLDLWENLKGGGQHVNEDKQPQDKSNSEGRPAAGGDVHSAGAQGVVQKPCE